MILMLVVKNIRLCQICSLFEIAIILSTRRGSETCLTYKRLGQTRVPFRFSPPPSGDSLSPNRLKIPILCSNRSYLLKEDSASQKRMQSHSSDGEQKFLVRKIEISDKNKGFIELLQQLSVCDSVSDEEFRERFQEINSYGDDHLVCVIEDDRSGKIIATGSVFIEKKFLRNCGKVGHIEDVAVDSCARGKQLGKKIIEFLTSHAYSMGCYKVILDCGNENKAFYEKCGFKQKEIQMVKYFI